MSLAAGNRVGLTTASIGSFESGAVVTKINKATCLTYATDVANSEDKFDSIYVGPGQTVYAVSAGTTSPSGFVEVSFQGVVFTNGL